MRVTLTLIALFSSFALFGQTDRDALTLHHTKAAASPSAAQVTAAYYALAPLDRQERTAMLNLMTPAMKAAMWKEHIAFVLAAHPELTTQQRDAINDTGGAISAALYDRSPAADLDRQAARVDFDNLLDRAKPMLTTDLVTALFYRIGPPAPVSSLTPVHLRPKTEVFDCSCSGLEDDPCYPACFGGFCVKQQWGCGPIGVDPCMNICNG